MSEMSDTFIAIYILICYYSGIIFRPRSLKRCFFFMQKKLIICLCWAYCLVLLLSYPLPASAGKLSGNKMGGVSGTLSKGEPAVSSFQTDHQPRLEAQLVAQADPAASGSDQQKPQPDQKSESPSIPEQQKQTIQPVQPLMPELPEAQQQPPSRNLWFSLL